MGTYKLIAIDEYEAMLDELAHSSAINLSTHDLLLYGGGQDRDFYPELSKDTRIDLLWTGWPGPKWTRFLSFIPGQGGLLRLRDMALFKEPYYELAAHSVSDFMYIPKSASPKMIEIAHGKGPWSYFDKLTKVTSGAWHVSSEADEAVPKDGKAMYFYNYCFGPDANEELKRIIMRK